MVRDVFNTSMSSNTKYFTLFTSHITLGLKALQRKMRILNKMRRFYPEELDEIEAVMGENYWAKQVKKYCPLLEGENINMEDMEITRRKKY